MYNTQTVCVIPGIYHYCNSLWSSHFSELSMVSGVMYRQHRHVLSLAILASVIMLNAVSFIIFN